MKSRDYFDIRSLEPGTDEHKVAKAIRLQTELNEHIASMASDGIQSDLSVAEVKMIGRPWHQKIVARYFRDIGP